LYVGFKANIDAVAGALTQIRNSKNLKKNSHDYIGVW